MGESASVIFLGFREWGPFDELACLLGCLALSAAVAFGFAPPRLFFAGFSADAASFAEAALALAFCFFWLGALQAAGQSMSSTNFHRI